MIRMLITVLISINLFSLAFTQDTIEGRWIPGGFSNTMYEFVDTEPFAEAGLRYTYYCPENSCDDSYWNSLDISDAIPNPNPYSVSADGNTLSIDLFFGTIATYELGFRCDGQMVDFYYDEDDIWEGLHSSMFRLGFDDVDNECLDANPDDCLCTEEWNPVCGVDGNTYSNACYAECEYVVIAYEDECQEALEECFDFTNIDFGDCEMVLGIGLKYDECSYVSGCDWIINGIDYSDLFFDSMDECSDACLENSFNGYLRESVVSDCQDACSQYYIEPEIDGGFGTVPIIFQNSNINIDLYMNRFVEVDLGQEVTCVECNAFEIQEINLSDNCQYISDCFQDPCIEAEECEINTPVECIPHFCGGCYADFYDLDGNLVDCNTSSNECIDLSGLDFGPCAMELGVGYVNGECAYISGCDWVVNGIDYSNLFFDSIDECDEQCSNNTICDEIEENYLELHSEEYTECEYDIDCMSVWGDCDISLGGCHYAVNILNYPEEEINEQVALWLENECMSSVCDCMDLPNVVCNNSNCELAYCSEPNPAGCIQTGCQEGYECVDNVECTPSQCYCDDSYGYWSCTEDCGGGTCVEVYSLGDINNDFQINVLDIVLLVSFILMIDEPTDIEFSAGDINLDENLNILDVVAVVQLILNNNTFPEDCYVVPEVGPCDGICPTYYYNQITNQCEEFITGCCGVEAFNTLQECQNTCE